MSREAGARPGLPRHCAQNELYQDHCGVRLWEGAESRCMSHAKLPAWMAPGEPCEGKRARGVAVMLDLTPSAVGGCLLSRVALVLFSPPPSAPPLASWPEGIASTAARWSFPRLGLPPPGPRSGEGRHRGLVHVAQNAPWCAVYTDTDAPVGAEPPGWLWHLVDTKEKLW